MTDKEKIKELIEMLQLSAVYSAAVLIWYSPMPDRNGSYHIANKLAKDILDLSKLIRETTQKENLEREIND